MKSISLLLLLFSITLFSQNKQVLYGFSEIPQSTLINPAVKLDNKWYLGIPLLSHLHANFGVSGLSAYDLLADNGVDFSTKVQGVITSMKRTDMFGVNQQLELFTAGYRLGKSYDQTEYITFGMYQETDFIFYYPEDIVDLVYEGNGTNINRSFDFGHLNLQAELLSVLHVGYAKKVNDQFSIGVRGKVYSSIFNVKSTNNAGAFTTRSNTTEKGNYYYTHDFDLDLELKSSGISSLLSDEEEGEDASENVRKIRNRFLFGGNLGLGIDVGFIKKVTEQTQIDGSIQDLGFIIHTKDVENYKLDNSYKLTGIEPKFKGVDSDQTANQYWDQLIQEFDELIKIDTTTTSYATMRPLKVNAALRYKFNGKNGASCNCEGEDNSGYKNEVGAQLFAITRPIRPQVAITGYFYKRFANALRAKATYTIDSYSFTNVGLGISAHFLGVNFYLMGDNLLRLSNLAKTQSQSVQLGFNYIFKKKL